MQLDLNSAENLTEEGVRKLFASKDDSEASVFQLRVTKEGVAYIAEDDVFMSDEISQSHSLVFESWNRSYVGKDAAKDDAWVARIFRALEKRREMYRPGSDQIPEAAVYVDVY